MKFRFNVDGDNLTLSKLKEYGYTGNVNSYICEFNLSEEWEKCYVFAVFSAGDLSFVQSVDLNKQCTIPAELLEESGNITVGLYGTFGNSQDDYKRIVTNCVMIEILEGAYKVSQSPQIPQKSVWEELVTRTVPIINSAGNWCIYSIETNTYEDTGVCARADKAVYYKKSEVEEAINSAILDSWEVCV